MTTRAESAAATARALREAAATLLDQGGVGAVTLRAVGARAGVSRGAPYGHFADKETLLYTLAIEGCTELAAELQRIRSDRRASSRERLTQAVIAFLTVARRRPHLYALMFTTPSRDPQALVDAAAGAQDTFLSMTEEVVGPERSRRIGALLMTTAHGIAGMERAGQLQGPKWGTTGDGIVEEVIGLISPHS
ncbi:MAG: TetR/AcrR family transcriptional regulator [Microbacterium sp.]|nr:TetR/AcrR family transcriptional regulator [Microbacterium sp.]